MDAHVMEIWGALNEGIHPSGIKNWHVEVVIDKVICTLRVQLFACPYSLSLQHSYSLSLPPARPSMSSVPSLAAKPQTTSLYPSSERTNAESINFPVRYTICSRSYRLQLKKA